MHRGKKSKRSIHVELHVRCVLMVHWLSMRPVIKFSPNAVPPPAFGVSPPEIAVPPPKVVVPPPGNVFMVHDIFLLS